MVELGAGRVLAFAAVIVVSLGSTWSGSAVASDDSTSGEPRETTQRIAPEGVKVRYSIS